MLPYFHPDFATSKVIIGSFQWQPRHDHTCGSAGTWKQMYGIYVSDDMWKIQMFY